MSPISNILLLQIESGNGSGHAPTAAADAIQSGSLNRVRTAKHSCHEYDIDKV